MTALKLVNEFREVAGHKIDRQTVFLKYLQIHLANEENFCVLPTITFNHTNFRIKTIKIP